MATISDLNVVIGANLDEFDRVFDELERGIGRLSNKVKDAGSTLTASLTLPLGLLAGAALKSASDIQALEKGLKATLKPGEDFAATLQNVQELAKLPGLGLQEALQGATNLQAAGFSADLAQRALAAFGNALATVGKGKSDLDGVGLALGQIASKGKISAEEINQLAERVPQIRQAMQAAFGTADTEVLQKAKISATDFVEGVTRELNKLPKVTGGLKNAFENLSDGGTIALAKLGDSLNKNFNIEGLLESLGSTVQELAAGFENLDPSLQNLIFTLAGAAAAAGPVLFVIGGIGAAIPAVSAGLAALGLAAGPVAIAFAAVAAAAYLIIDNWSEVKAYFTTGEGGRVFDQLLASLSEVGSLISSALSPVIDALTGAFGGLGEGIDFVKVALDLLTLPIRLVISTFSGLIEIIFGVNEAINGLIRLDFDRAFEGLSRGVSGALRPLMALRGQTEEVAKRPANEGLSDYFADLTNNALNALTPIQALKAEVDKPVGAAAAKLTVEQANALAKLNEQLRLNQLNYQALGDAYDVVGNRQRILQGGVEDLVKVGFAPAGRVVQGFRARLLEIPDAIGAIETPLTQFLDKIAKLAASQEAKAFNPFGEFDAGALPTELPALDNSAYLASLQQATAAQGTFTDAMAAFNDRAGDAVGDMNSIISAGLAEAAANMAAGIGAVLTGAAPISDLAGILLGTVGDVLIQLGKLAITTGIVVEAIKKAFTNPFAAVAAGVAAIAIGSAIKGAAGSILSGGRGGSSGIGNLAGGRSGSGIATPTGQTPQAQKLEIKVAFEPITMRQEGPALAGVLNVSNYRTKRFS